VTRASINLRKSFSKTMDCRVKPGNDGLNEMAAVLNFKSEVVPRGRKWWTH
jgi:hypothetical protein